MDLPVTHQLRELERDIVRRVTGPFDAIFDLLADSGTTMHRQAEALESAGRALQESARLMRSQADMFERTVTVLRQPTELAKLAAGIERQRRDRA